MPIVQTQEIERRAGRGKILQRHPVHPFLQSLDPFCIVTSSHVFCLSRLQFGALKRCQSLSIPLQLLLPEVPIAFLRLTLLHIKSVAAGACVGLASDEPK